MKVVLPFVLAGSVGFSQVLGPHDPHVVEQPVQQESQLVGVLAANVVSTATVSAIPMLNSWMDYR